MSVSSANATTDLETPNGHTTRREETRRRLLEAGTAAFAEIGLHGITTARIARRAGVGTGTFYLHFPDKHALGFTCAEVATQLGCELHELNT